MSDRIDDLDDFSVEYDILLDFERRIESLVDIGTNSTIVDAYVEYAKERGYDDLVWTPVRDTRTCILCVEGDGTIFKSEEASGLIPAHINCRCIFRVKEEGILERWGIKKEENKFVSEEEKQIDNILSKTRFD